MNDEDRVKQARSILGRVISTPGADPFSEREVASALTSIADTSDDVSDIPILVRVLYDHRLGFARPAALLAIQYIRDRSRPIERDALPSRPCLLRWHGVSARFDHPTLALWQLSQLERGGTSMPGDGVFLLDEER